MKYERGNILFLILLAVILFAALSYAVTQSLQGGGKDSSNETLSATASILIQHGDNVSVAVKRMMLVNNCADNQISCDAPGLNNGYTNPNTPADKCKIFHPDGGGVPYLTPPTVVGGEYLYSGTGNMSTGVQPYAHCSSGNTSCPDLVMRSGPLSKPLCLTLNARHDVRTTNGQPLVDGDSSGVSKFTGSFARSEGIEAADPVTGEAGGIGEKVPPGLCMERPTGTYYYYHVLLARFP